MFPADGEIMAGRDVTVIKVEIVRGCCWSGSNRCWASLLFFSVADEEGGGGPWVVF